MNRITAILIIIIGLMYSDCLTSQSRYCDNLPYQDGEQLEYVVYYNWKFVWIPAGQVIFSVKDQGDFIQYDVTGLSFPSYDSFFMVRDYYTSIVDKESGWPTMFRRDVSEGNYMRYDSIKFDQSNFYVEEHFGRTEATVDKFEFNLDQFVDDMVSVIYKLRQQGIQDLNEGDRIPVKIFFDKELFELDVNYKGLQNVKVKNYGKLRLHHFQPELIDGYVFKQGDLMDIWVTDDLNQIPIMIESPISYGSIKAVLRSTIGLKHNNPIIKDQNKQ